MTDVVCSGDLAHDFLLCNSLSARGAGMILFLVCFQNPSFRVHFVSQAMYFVAQVHSDKNPLVS